MKRSTEEKSLEIPNVHYQNVMESLVDKEVTRQFKKLPESLAKMLDPSEVATYALNRLPPLYASCEKGRNQQKLFADEKLRLKIPEAVRQGIGAVQGDPLRNTTPLIPETTQMYRAAMAALYDLRALLDERHLLDDQVLSWNSLTYVVKRAIDKTAWGIMRRQGIKPSEKVYPQAQVSAPERVHTPD